MLDSSHSKDHSRNTFKITDVSITDYQVVFCIWFLNSGLESKIWRKIYRSDTGGAKRVISI